MNNFDPALAWLIMSDSSLLIIRCSFCAESMLIADRRPGFLLEAPRMFCPRCGIESQWHSCHRDNEARRYLQQEAEKLGKDELSAVAMSAGRLREILQIAEEKGWQNIGQTP